MRIAYPLSFIATLGFLTTSALATDDVIQLVEVSGKVLVTTADGVIPAEVGQVVLDGNSIFVGDEAVARLSATDGACDVSLPQSKVTTIDSKKLCSEVIITPTASDIGPGGIPPAAIGVGFFTAVAGTALIVTLTNDDDDPVSAP